jgi:hypothetical protein
MELIEFAQKYCTVMFSGIDDAYIKELHPFQIDFLNSLQKYRFTHTTKSRQVMGLGSMIAIYCAWFLLFHVGDDQKPGTIVLGSSKYELACELLKKVQVILDAYMRDNPNVKQVLNNKRKKSMDNNNLAIAISTTVPSLCSLSVNVAIIDEAAYCSDLEEFYKAILPIFSANSGSLHLVSTPNGFDYFNTLKTSNFHVQQYHYSLNPSAKHRVEQLRKTLSKEYFDQDMELKIFNQNHTSKDKILQFRIDNQMLSQLNERLLTVDLSISDYIRGLIKKDLSS